MTLVPTAGSGRAGAHTWVRLPRKSVVSTPVWYTREKEAETFKEIPLSGQFSEP